MSQNDQPAAAGKPAINELLQTALNAYGAQVLRECTQLDGSGNQVMAIPFAQLLCDVRVLEVKLKAILDELEREQLLDPAKVCHRVIRELELQTRQLKQVIDARPKVAIAQAIGGINGRNHG